MTAETSEKEINYMVSGTIEHDVAIKNTRIIKVDAWCRDQMPNGCPYLITRHLGLNLGSICDFSFLPMHTSQRVTG